MTSALLSSKVVIVEESPSLPTISEVPTSVCGAVGVTERGPVNEAILCTSFDEYRRVFGGDVAAGYVCGFARGFFENGGTRLHVVRTVHLSDPADPLTKTSTKASLSLLTTSLAPSSAALLGTIAGPYNLEPGDTLVVAIDGGAPATATFNATAAARVSSAEPFALANNDTLLVSVDGGPVQTVVFLTSEFASIAAATAEEVAAVINSKTTGLSATATGGGTTVTIASDKRGTASSINVSGGTANAALGFTTGLVSGTGNVASIDAVTAAEAALVGQAAVSGSTWTVSSGAVRIASNTTGPSSSVQVQASSTADDELGFANAVVSGSTGAAVPTLTVRGKTDGTYAHALSVVIAPATSGDSNEFNLSVVRAGVTLEAYQNVSMDPAAARYVEAIVNDVNVGSNYVEVDDLSAPVPAPGDIPASGTFGPLAGGNDGLVGLVNADFTGGSGVNGKTGLRALDLVEDLSILAVPGKANAAVHNAMLSYCEVTRAGSVFAVLDCPQLSSAAAVVTYVRTTAALKQLSEFGAIYWPWVKVANPSEAVYGKTLDGTIVVPPSGIIAGVYARTDAARDGGVFDPPAGEERGVMFGVLGFETNECLDEQKRDLVYPELINPLTTRSGLPRYIDGTRTLKDTGNFPTIAERRGVIFVEQSIKNGLGFARHANNDDALRARASRVCEAFLTIQMNRRAFRTRNPKTAFFVDFGVGLNTPAVVASRRLLGRIGLATQRPADFVILSFSQDTRSFELAAIHPPT